MVKYKINHRISRTWKKPQTKWLFLTPVVLLVGFASILFAHSPQEKKIIENISSSAKGKGSSGPAGELKLAAVGDMLPHETVTDAAKTSGGGYDYSKLISPSLIKSFQSADLRFCNQEAPSAEGLGVRGYPTFNAPQEFPKSLSSFGCNLINTANNHANDFGQAGIKGTLGTWDKLGPLAKSGSYRSRGEAEKLNIIEKNGIKLGFTAFNEMNNQPLEGGDISINMLSDSARLEQQIKGLRAQSDVVIVSVHWGKENSHDLTKNQKDFAQRIADLGADIIIGTGPHVWQPYVELSRSNGGVAHVWYSIGNGLNSQTTPDQLFSGIALLTIKRESDGKVSISKPVIIPTYMHYIWGGSIGTAQSQLLARKDLSWNLLYDSEGLIASRNDFKTNVEAQVDALKRYVNNPNVEILKSY